MTQAIDFYKQALWHNPTDAAIRNNLALAYMHSADYPNAIIEFAKVIELAPYAAQAYFNIFACFTLVGEAEMAEVAVYEACRLFPEMPISWSMLLHQWQNQCRWENIHSLTELVLTNLGKQVGHIPKEPAKPKLLEDKPHSVVSSWSH